MHSFVRLSPRCFPEKVWKRSSEMVDCYTQVAPDDRDITRREAMAAWQLGLCSLTQALDALRRIEWLDRQCIADKQAELKRLAREARA